MFEGVTGETSQELKRTGRQMESTRGDQNRPISESAV